MSADKKLLLLEDNDAYRKLVSFALSQRLPGYSIVEAATLQGAREVCEQDDPQIAVLDMTLPDGMATDLLHDWQGRLQCGLKVVVFSSYDAEEVAPALHRLGASAYVNKERGMKPLIQAIQSALEEAPKAA